MKNTIEIRECPFCHKKNARLSWIIDCEPISKTELYSDVYAVTDREAMSQTDSDRFRELEMREYCDSIAIICPCGATFSKSLLNLILLPCGEYHKDSDYEEALIREWNGELPVNVD